MKRIFSSLIAGLVALSLLPITAFAYTVTDQLVFDSGAFKENGDPADGTFTFTAGGPGATSTISGDAVRLGQRLYFPLSTTTQANGINVESEFFDSKLFSFKLVRDQNSKLLNSVTATTKKFSSSSTRLPYIMVDLKNSAITAEEKVTFEVYFRALKDDSTGASRFVKDNIYNVKFTLWVQNNEEDSGDVTLAVGEGTVVKPISGDNNIVRWGTDYDVACLEYYAADNAKSFFVKLSTKVDNSIYEALGAPVDADMFFRDFSSSDTIDATSRGTITLYDPWDVEFGGNYSNNYRRVVDPDDVFLYRLDPDGYLTDITNDSSVSYVSGNNTDAGLPGWQIRTRVLGAYILSDTDLNTYEEEPDESLDEVPDESLDEDLSPTPVPSQGPAAPPATGSSDFVVLAAMLGIVSLGAVALISRRRRK